MDLTRWIFTIVLGLAPMLGGMALQPAGNSVISSVSTGANSGANSGGNSGANSGSNSGAKSGGGSSNSGSGSSVTPGVTAPKAKVTNPHGPISTPCANCHSYTSWKPVRSNPEFNHDLTGYPLRGMHENVNCVQCHTSLVFKNVSTQCADCHADIHQRQFSANCASCHSVKGWQVSLQAIQNHQNRFPLVGAHSLVNCEGCHKNAAVGQFVGLSTACYSCHQQDFLTPVVDHVGLGFPTTCQTCHTVDSWFNAKFDHLKYTGYALTGAHATLTCAACHLNNVFKGTSAACYSCHSTDFLNTNNPNHGQVGFPKDCGICHSTTDWTTSTFNHAVYAKYPLTGGHANLTCAQCHGNNSFSNTSTDCVTCHLNDFNNAKSPVDHVAGGFPQNCQMCHTITVWTNSTFNHNNTKFPLTGAHQTVQCAQCHTNGDYSSDLKTTCIGCHSNDYNTTKDPPHAQLPNLFPTATCQNCHNTTSWNGAPFDHSKTTFQLVGAHANGKVTCAQCHINNDYSSDLKTTCIGCHQTDFSNATSPVAHAGFPTDCVTCHGAAPMTWMTGAFNHSAAATGFALVGAHTSLQCAQCHNTPSPYDGSLPKTCYGSGCHTKDYDTASAPPHNGQNGEKPFPQDCTTCHGTAPATWNSGFTFNHVQFGNGWALTGMHASQSCAACHNSNFSSPNLWMGTPTACLNCHKSDLAKATNPSHTGFPQDCGRCHNTTSWTSATFDHTKFFPLVGAHTSLQCAQCHTDASKYVPNSLPKTCYGSGCHTKDYDTASAPPHNGQNGEKPFPQDCTTCHGTAPTTWMLGVTFNHVQYGNGWALTGAHAAQGCTACHNSTFFHTGPWALTSASTACITCHASDFANATTPQPHKGFSTACQNCHNTSTWLSGAFTHSVGQTGFALVGAHVNLQCAQCHTDSTKYVAGSLPKDCYSCHTAQFTSANNPPHGSFPHDCTTCHGTAPMTWTTATFNHTLSATGFALVGAHVNLQCSQCHNTASPYDGSLPKDCYSCHIPQFTSANNPPHTTFPHDCTTCHGAAPMTWTTATFNHSAPPISFALVGAHAALTCDQCHKSGNYSIPSTSCTQAGCHLTDFQNTANPSHVALGYPQTCTTCHTMTDWTLTGMTFNHGLYGGTPPWALTGFHATMQCVQCHQTNNYGNPLPPLTTCLPCHQNDLTTLATNPNHVQAGFPPDCSICHSTTAWNPSTFNHATTTFPLTASHSSLQCNVCHTSASTYNGSLPTTCYSSGCHLNDYNNTTDPAHATANQQASGLFPTDCTVCHGAAPTNWTGATFNHNATPFPLTGVHVTTDCNACHAPNNTPPVFAGTTTTCDGCHDAVYKTSTTPVNHIAANLPNTCNTCHTTTNWTSGTLPSQYHTMFNQNHGNANGVCTTCHTNTSDYSVFQCTGCHGGNNANNFNHPNVSGYVYNSVNCYACHTKG